MKWKCLAVDMILYIENPKDSTKKGFRNYIKYSKVAVYKINVEKYIAFLYTSNNVSEKEIKKFLLQLQQKE